MTLESYLSFAAFVSAAGLTFLEGLALSKRSIASSNESGCSESGGSSRLGCLSDCSDLSIEELYHGCAGPTIRIYQIEIEVTDDECSNLARYRQTCRDIEATCFEGVIHP